MRIILLALLLSGCAAYVPPGTREATHVIVICLFARCEIPAPRKPAPPDEETVAHDE